LRDLDALVRDLLDEPGGPPNVDRLATEFLGHSWRAAAARLFELVRRRPSEAAVRGVLPLLSELAERSPRWRSIVHRSLTRKGRCPADLRKELRAMLSARAARPVSVGPMEREPARHARSSREVRVETGRTATIRLSTEGTSLRGIPNLLEALARIRTPKRLVVKMDGDEHMYVFGLTVLAGWARARHIRPDFASPQPETRAYLERIGFIDAVEGRPHRTGPVSDHGWAVAIEPIGTGVAAEELAARITAICDTHGFVGRGDRNALVITFAELIENVQRHAGPTRDALVAAQFYPQRRRLSIAVVDTGVGIRASFLEGRNDVAKRRIHAGESPLELAVSPLVTSKPVREKDKPGHAGYGLYVVSELTVRNGGTFSLTSDARTLTMNRHPYGRTRAHVRSHAPWQGTIVAVVLNLDNLLPIGEVYSSLPLPAGYEEEDFFS
jgi:hypothetical protein